MLKNDLVRIGIRLIHNNVVFTRFSAHTGLNGLRQRLESFLRRSSMFAFAL